MDKIPESAVSYLNPASLATVNTSSQKTRRKSALTEGGKARFSTALEIARQEEAGEAGSLDPAGFAPSEEAVQGLLDAVHNAGDALKNRPLPDEVLRYKRAVKDFLKYVIERTYIVEQEIGIPNSLKPGFNKPRSSPEARNRKTYNVVQVVDRKLDQLAAGILAGQSNQLEILQRLEEIKGILVDLLQ